MVPYFHLRNIALQVTANSSLIYSTAYTRPGSRLSFAEVICPLLNESVVPADLSNIAWKGSYIARGYTIAIANDGIHYGEYDSIVVYDSTCVNCTKVGNNVTCTQTVSQDETQLFNF